MPMTIYKFAVLEDQEWIFPVDGADFETFFAMDGRAIQDWAPPVMRMVEAEQGAEEPSYSDFPWLGEHAPILKKPAVDALAPVLAQYGQLLPLKGENVWLFNVTTVLDVLDREKSGIVYFDDGDILDIERHVFKRDVIGTAEIFKLPRRASAVYVTGRFVEQVRGSGLRGVSFAPVWTSEE
ncbi:hypothetical protein ASE61_19140 [Bosea sp. Root670]|uniref:imm11 family protein n=1 Tax=Bosea sp. Root670 TaxID=1736583 RepID=UPI0007140372|nr:DUF1629 domain-containing protein [Bosea sp. Root670]KRE01069.1 hypothetical protein ASE61_19140 [Bosea sp. Root670]